MAQFERTEIGNLALVQETEDGRIRQIGLTEEQSKQLQFYCALISKNQPLVQMGKEYDLVLERLTKNKEDYEFTKNNFIYVLRFNSRR